MTNILPYMELIVYLSFFIAFFNFISSGQKGHVSSGHHFCHVCLLFKFQCFSQKCSHFNVFLGNIHISMFFSEMLTFHCFSRKFSHFNVILGNFHISMFFSDSTGVNRTNLKRNVWMGLQHYL